MTFLSVSVPENVTTISREYVERENLTGKSNWATQHSEKLNVESTSACRSKRSKKHRSNIKNAPRNSEDIIIENVIPNGVSLDDSRAISSDSSNQKPNSRSCNKPQSPTQSTPNTANLTPSKSSIWTLSCPRPGLDYNNRCADSGEPLTTTMDVKSSSSRDSKETWSKKWRRIVVCVRKRPRNRREIACGDKDIVSIPNEDHIVISEPRQRFDLTEYLDRTAYRFDYCFDERVTTSEVYKSTAAAMVDAIFQGYMATCFAYGQTGSGKTFTMAGPKVSDGHGHEIEDGIYGMVVNDLFRLYEASEFKKTCTISVNFFEIYCNKVHDLLNQKQLLRVMEDASGRVQILGLREYIVWDANTTLALLRNGYQLRTSGQTLVNEYSSRSHAIFQINIRRRLPRDKPWLDGDERMGTGYHHITSTPCTYPNPYHSGPLVGRFSLVDLAGNERSADSACMTDRAKQLESGEINKSLLALKECIRAMGSRQRSYLPFRTSKLTQVLRESFVGPRSCTCMIATVSPSLSCCEHTMNTLRYATRVKQLVPAAHICSVTYGTAMGTNQLSRTKSAMLQQVVVDYQYSLAGSTRPRSTPSGPRSRLSRSALPRQNDAIKFSKSNVERSASSITSNPNARAVSSHSPVTKRHQNPIIHPDKVSRIEVPTASTGDSQLSLDQLATELERFKNGMAKGDRKESSPNISKPLEAASNKGDEHPSSKRRHSLRVQRQKHEVLKKHSDFVKNLPQWITEHTRLLNKASEEKTNMMAYVNLLTDRLRQDIEQLEMIKEDARILRGLQIKSK